MMWKVTVPAVALVFLSATRAFSDPPSPSPQISAVVKACVEVSRAQEVYKGPGWHFDAYYNAATGRVHNNIDNPIAQVRFLYAFEKCMAERGFPLGNKDGGKDATR